MYHWICVNFAVADNPRLYSSFAIEFERYRDIALKAIRMLHQENADLLRRLGILFCLNFYIKTKIS